MSTGRPLNAKLFLEGIEVPFIGATITHTVNQAAIAYIDLIPHASINNIKPRTKVHLLVRDFNNPSDGFPFVLAYEGEVFGFSFGKTPSSRSFAISCIDDSSYWDNVLTYFFNAQQSLSKGAQDLASYGRDAQDIVKQGGIGNTPVTHAVSSYFLQIVKKALAGKRDDGSKPDFLDGLVAVYKSISDINEFYRLAEDRLRIVDRIKIRSTGELTRLLKETEALEWFSGIIGRTSGFQTLRMVLQDLMSILFHDFVSVPFPAAVLSSSVKKPLTSGKKPSNTIGEFVFKPNLYMMPAPACNIFYPDEYSSFNYTRNFFQEPTRLIYKPEMPVFGQTGQPVSLAHIYEPDSFNFFMTRGKGTPPSDTVGDGALQTSSKDNFGKFGDADTDPISSKTNNGKKREQQFLTNEEKLKGILMAQETMVPATTQFRQALSEAGRKDFSQLVAKYLFFKKRFQSRELQITSHLKMSVVPGFPVLILDDSDAGQTVLSYCSSVTHRIYATQGGYTNVTLSYARTVDEQDQTSGKAGEPLIPPWFSKDLFGEIKKPPKSTNKKVTKPVEDAGNQLVVPKALSQFYESLLGKKGSQSINDVTGEVTLLGASIKLIDEYKIARKRGGSAVTDLIDLRTRRDYVGIKEAMGFIGATTNAKNYTDEFLEFTGPRFSGTSGARDDKQIQLRRDVIKAYRDIIKSRRGFRG